MVKSRRKKTGKGVKKDRNPHTYKIIYGFFTLILLLGFGLYVLHLDRLIRDKFSGQRWTLPARVYASPYEIYVGRSMTIAVFTRILADIGYTQGDSASQPGRYTSDNTQITIHTRQFSFWDGDVPAQKLSVKLQDGRIVSITEPGTGKPRAVFRLEPQLIGKIYPLHNEDRVLVPYDRVPQVLVDALIATEDRHFYSHTGIDPKGIVRAFIANLRSAELVQGGSTLTQQLVKNFFLNPERTLKRKFNEMIMALLLEYRYSKAEILSAYINEVYLGQDGARGIHGFGTAAEFYFGKPLDELSTAQIALLVGLVRGASYYHPVRNSQRALARRNRVLEQLHSLGFISR
ncbi:MAG: transglycosylase domain-containing protein, partial [Proteobacteria bacterium]|nr:transglycosylase domain-containing protein [Pseudomonadota bacterium]